MSTYGLAEPGIGPPGRYRLRGGVEIDLAEHVPGTPDRYRHGWIPINPGTEFVSASKKWGNASKFRDKAQSKAESRYLEAMREAGVGDAAAFGDYPDDAMHLNPKTDEYAWAMYQCSPFVDINHYLRTGEVQQTTNVSFDVPEVAKNLKDAFRTMGTTTDKPIKLFRGLSNKHEHDWEKEIEPGKTYEDKGVVSTGSDENGVFDFLQGTNFDSNGELSADAMMEIHVPAGTQVLGGTVSGIELMLAPGTKFHVISKETVDTGVGGTALKFTVEVVK